LWTGALYADEGASWRVISSGKSAKIAEDKEWLRSFPAFGRAKTPGKITAHFCYSNTLCRLQAAPDRRFLSSFLLCKSMIASNVGLVEKAISTRE
jgi:hypothetical protein